MNKKNKLYLLLIIFFALVLRFYGLGTRPFDGDEGIMVLISHNTFVDLITRASFDVHPPLYHILLKLFLNFGISEWTTRLLSALTGIGSVYLTFIFVNRLFDGKKNHTKQVATVSAFLTTISPYLIYPFQEARMYSLFLFLTLGSYYFFLKLIDQKRKKLEIFLYIIFTSLTLYTHYLGFVVLSSQVAYWLVFKRENIGSWILSWITIITLFLPQLPTMLSQFFARFSEQSQALSLGENIKGLIGSLYRFGAGRMFLDLSPSNLKAMIFDNPIYFLLFIITLIVPFWLFIKGVLIIYRNHKKEFLFLITPMIIAVLLAILSTEIGSRSSRYLIYIYPFYLIFVSFGFLYYLFPVILEPEVPMGRSDIGNLYKLDSRIRGNDKKIKWTVIIPILFLVSNISGLIYHYQYEAKAPGVNKIAEFISDNYHENDIVLIRGGFGGGEKWVFDYYWHKLQVTSYKLQVFDMLGDYKAGNLAQLKSIKPEDKIKELLNDHNTIFFYDMTYETKNIPNATKHNLGYDKEKKELIVWEVSK